MNSHPDTAQRYDTTRQAWEEIWDDASVDIELEAVQYHRAQDTIEAYLPYLDKEAIHLEAGSGLSAVVIDLQNRGYRVVGMDYAVNALLVSKQYDAELLLTAGDVHQMPVANDSVGSYLSFGVLEHFEQGMQPALKEAYRIIRPGGVVVLTIPYPNLVYRLVQWRRNQRGESRLTDDDFYESTYTKEELIANIEQAGFTVEHTQPTGHDFTWWGLGGVFQAQGYYKSSRLAEVCGAITSRLLPWQFNFMTLIIGRKP